MTMQVEGLKRLLIEGWQRAFPVVPRPFAAIAGTLGVSEADVIDETLSLVALGIVTRVGVTVRPNTIGASLLAAMRIPAGNLDRIAAIVSADPCVNHNYEREHAFNLWFVVTAPDRTGLSKALSRLRAGTGLDILELPMERPYYLDLGFPLDCGDSHKSKAPARHPLPATVTIVDEDRAVLAAIEDGIDIVQRPFLAVARRTGLDEGQVMHRIERLVTAGIVSRFGLIVRHRALGIEANAMTVWNIPDARVDDVGRRLAAEPCVTLCYRRPRRLPDWPYNLFAMVHGRERTLVERQIAELARRQQIDGIDHAVLFSRRCFTQRGARFKAA